MMKYILAIDQSTAATKAMLFDENGTLVIRRDIPHRQITNDQGWVEHDPEEIYQNTLTACKTAVEESGIAVRGIAAIGISNQRETAVCWDRGTGKPVCNAIVWQCPRATEIAARLERAGYGKTIRQKTGMQLSPYFSAAKFAWILENVPQAAILLKQNQLCCGNVDAWLLYRMTGGVSFKTDYSNASRTQLLNLETLFWDDVLLQIFGLEASALPQPCESNSQFGTTTLGGLLPEPVPIHAMIGDSSAALYANGCIQEQMAKATFGTGTSVMMNAGERRKRPEKNIVESIGWRIGGKTTYVLEGNINYTGALIKWLVDDMELLESSRDSGRIARSVGSTGGVYLVPAFTGLGAPYWKDNARAILCGMNRTTKRAHVIRAAEEAIAYQIRDIVEEINACYGRPLREICVDGGAKNDAFLMGFTADILRIPVKIPDLEELSGAGAAYLAAVGAGIAPLENLLAGRRYTTVSPQMGNETRDALYNGWKQAVDMLLEQ